jgi:hypothetical protein
MKSHQNPLFEAEREPHADLTQIDRPTVFVTRRTRTKREIRDARRLDTAAEALADFDRDTQIHGLTKGQFSLLDVLTAIIQKTGPAHLDISTWTAAKTDVATVCNWLNSGAIESSRWLVDLTFQRRTPEVADQIRRLFGPDAIRVAQNHCKLSLLGNAEWAIVIQTSMNLNFNPRFENFTVAHDPALHAFYTDIFDHVWKRQPRHIADARPWDIIKHFESDL